jgi:hypothetical protein
MSTAVEHFDHLTLHEEKGPKQSDDNPAVIIPDHLQVSNADCPHLTFGSFVSGTLDAPLSVKPLNNDGEVATESDNQTTDHSDVRYVFILKFFTPIVLLQYLDIFFSELTRMKTRLQQHLQLMNMLLLLQTATWRTSMLHRYNSLKCQGLIS